MTSALILSEIFIYPVKSLGPISLSNAEVEERGLRHDRRWLIIDDNNRFVTQRQYPNMALIEVKIMENGLQLRHRTRDLSTLLVPFQPETFDLITVTVWDDQIEAVIVNDASNRWLTEALGFSARLVYQPDTSPRPADPKYAPFEANVSFADGYPFLVIGQSSLDDLNTRLPEPVSMRRFRPNLVFEGGLPYDEDQWYEFSIGDIVFYGVKPCARCILTTVDPEKGEFAGKEPVKTLSTYRKRNNKIFFGQNLLTAQTGVLKVGDEINVVSRKERQTMSE
ncbi:MOSC domain-containing protein [Runella sp.]|uniref:MOSC domain-containing protein n=1 Tax=Runella sp. TaxID=1960881 RepID=UPI003D1457D3